MSIGCRPRTSTVSPNPIPRATPLRVREDDDRHTHLDRSTHPRRLRQRCRPAASARATRSLRSIVRGAESSLTWRVDHPTLLGLPPRAAPGSAPALRRRSPSTGVPRRRPRGPPPARPPGPTSRRRPRTEHQREHPARARDDSGRIGTEHQGQRRQPRRRTPARRDEGRPSYGDQVFEPVEEGLPDPAHLHQVSGRGERPVRSPSSRRCAGPAPDRCAAGPAVR